MANIEARKNKNGKIISYRIKIYKGRDSNGKRLKPYTKTWKVPENWSDNKIQKELNRIATLYEEECKSGLVVDNRQTFSQYAEYVINLKEKNGIKHQTITLYKKLLERINIAIGHIKLTDIRPQHLNNFYEQLRNDINLTTGGKLSAKTIREYHALIGTILKQAEKEMLVTYNAASKASPPKNKRKPAQYLEIDEIKTIFNILEKEPLKWKVLIKLLAVTGARRGEILGLKWNKINFKENTIYIDNNLLYTQERGIYEESPKTESSIRYVTLPKETILLLKQYKKIYMEQKLSIGNKWIGKDNFIFTQENGLPMHPDSVTNYCRKLQNKYNIKIKEENKELPETKQKREIKLSPHIFRHSQASILIFMKVDPVTVSKRLGHSQVSTTSDIYSHIMKKADEGAAETLSQVLR